MFESISEMANSFDGGWVFELSIDKPQVVEGISIGSVAKLENLFETFDGLLILCNI